jgi:hypothetical protein
MAAPWETFVWGAQQSTVEHVIVWSCNPVTEEGGNDGID